MWHVVFYWFATLSWILAVFAAIATVASKRDKLEHFCYVLIFILLGILCIKQV